MADVRYDPVWGRMPLDGYHSKIQGGLRPQFQRLERLMNWGCLSWLYPVGRQNKLDHHIGLQFQVVEMLRHNAQQQRHAASLRVAAELVHLGHLPYSYAMEHAVVRAAQINPRVARELEQIIDDVIAFGELECVAEAHRCKDDVIEDARPFELYKWLAAWRLPKHWKKIWSAVQQIETNPPSEAAFRKALVRTLVCREDRGYQYLTRADLADYVLRDVLFSGASRIEIDPGTLYDKDVLGVESPREWRLIDAAASYLQQSYFETPSARLLHDLVTRVFAQDLISRNASIASLLELDDQEAVKKMGVYYRGRLSDLRDNQVRSWQLMTVAGRLSVPAEPVDEVERRLINRAGVGRLSYPFTDSFAVVVHPSRSRMLPLAGDGRRYVDVQVHIRTDAPNAFTPLTLAARVNRGLQARHARDMRQELMSWLARERCQVSGVRIEEAVGLILMRDVQSETVDLFRSLASARRWSDMQEHRAFMLDLWQARRLVESASAEGGADVGQFAINLPWKAFSLAPGQRLLTALRDAATRRVKTPLDGIDRGYALEAATWADQMLAPDPVEDRLIAMHVVRFDQTNRPSGEWDLVRIDLHRDRTWSVHVCEASVTTSEKKRQESREQIEALGQRLQSRFADFTKFRGQLVEPDRSGGLDYQSARRDFDE